MNDFEKKCTVIKYEKLSEMLESLEGKVITINPNNTGVFNPFILATENALTIDEKESKLRTLLDILDGVEYAKERLKDMSFLDDEPEWKERATLILKEYAKI